MLTKKVARKNIEVKLIIISKGRLQPVRQVANDRHDRISGLRAASCWWYGSGVSLDIIGIVNGGSWRVSVYSAVVAFGCLRREVLSTLMTDALVKVARHRWAIHVERHLREVVHWLWVDSAIDSDVPCRRPHRAKHPLPPCPFLSAFVATPLLPSLRTSFMDDPLEELTLLKVRLWLVLE